jgi:CubicO group peptidase (beta-lactamase class C family)
VAGIALVVAVVCSVWPAAQAQPSVDLFKLDSYFEQSRKDLKVPGMAIAIVKDDAIVFVKGYGVRQMGTTDNVDDRTLFAIASNTKAFTSAALAILVDEGVLGWKSHVREFFPSFELYDDYVSADMRIEDLLSHRSGLGTFSGDLMWYGTSYSREDVVRRARYLEQAFPFRAGYGYSNIMFLAAGVVLEKASGQSWEDFITERILLPLGMNETVLSTDALEGKVDVATPHGEHEGELVSFPWYNWDNMAPAGGIISSARDMAQWMRLQLGRGTLEGKTVFSESQARKMWTPHASFVVSKRSEANTPSRHFSGYGLGWGISDYLGRKIISHGGGYDGMFSHQVLVPEENLGVIVLTNSMTGTASALTQKVLDAYLGAPDRDWSAEALKRSVESDRRKKSARMKDDSARVMNTTPSLPLVAYSGTYGGPMYGNAEVTLEQGELVLSFIPNPDLVGDLMHWHFDTFVIEWRKKFPWFGGGKVQFFLDQDGEVTEMKIDVPNEDFWFTELEFKK